MILAVMFSTLKLSLSLRPWCMRWQLCMDVPGCWQVPSPTRRETSSEECQGRARFQYHQDTSCHEICFLQVKAPKEIQTILTEILACSFLVGIRTYQHTC